MVMKLTNLFALEVAACALSAFAVLSPESSFLSRSELSTAPAALLRTNSSTASVSLQNLTGADRALFAALPGSSKDSSLEDEVNGLFKMSSLRGNMSKAAFEATPLGASVSKIVNIIEKVMMPKVQEAHDANQKELKKSATDLRKCGSTKDTQVGMADLKKDMYLKFSPLHKTCRAGEAGFHTEKTTCWDEESDKRKIKQLKCSAFALVKKQLSDENANRQIMKKGGSESDESYVTRVTSTLCGSCTGKGCASSSQPRSEGKCKYAPYTCGCGAKCRYDKAKDACTQATQDWKAQEKKCKAADKQYNEQRKNCDSLQAQMDDSSCKRAVQMKDACETYSECFTDKLKGHRGLESMVKKEEKDRKAEWRGLKRMHCLIKAFSSGEISDRNIQDCKKKTHSTDHLIIEYPKLPKLVTCSIPELYPNTALYKKENFAPLPALAKGKMDAYTCTGVEEISIVPSKGSPKSCKCSRVTLNGPYSPGPMVKCENCRDIRRSLDKSSCPDGTKLFAPRSRADWKTFLVSATPLRAPNFVIDITRPQNGCGGCARQAMNSGNDAQSSWKTVDGAAWWLRSASFAEPSRDYNANCYMDVWKKTISNENQVTFNAQSCQFHSKSYYCQPARQALTPKPGSPSSCACKLVTLTGRYSAGSLIKCENCLRVSRSMQKNSCPVGTKLFSPRTRADWKTVIASVTPLRSPHWIIDVTQAQNGCGGCTKYAMKSTTPQQATWRTSDSSPWYLRPSRYSEPNGDYYANCYLNVGSTANEDTITFNDNKCKVNSNAYYCQPSMVKKKEAAPAPPPPPPPRPPRHLRPMPGGRYKGYKCASGSYTGASQECGNFVGVSAKQCWQKCHKSASAMDKKQCDKVTGMPKCVAMTYDKKTKTCALHRECTKLVRSKGTVSFLKKRYHPRLPTLIKKDKMICKGKAYTSPDGEKMGFKKVTEKQCMNSCLSNKWSGEESVSAKKRCGAMAFYPKDGYCDLFSNCRKGLESEKGVISYVKSQAYIRGWSAKRKGHVRGRGRRLRKSAKYQRKSRRGRKFPRLRRGKRSQLLKSGEESVKAGDELASSGSILVKGKQEDAESDEDADEDADEEFEDEDADEDAEELEEDKEEDKEEGKKKDEEGDADDEVKDADEDEDDDEVKDGDEDGNYDYDADAADEGQDEDQEEPEDPADAADSQSGE